MNGSGTFTLNNYGVFGVDGSAAIINHPEVAILGVDRIIGFLRFIADAMENPGAVLVEL